MLCIVLCDWMVASDLTPYITTSSCDQDFCKFKTKVSSQNIPKI